MCLGIPQPQLPPLARLKENKNKSIAKEQEHNTEICGFLFCLSSLTSHPLSSCLGLQNVSILTVHLHIPLVF